MIVVPGNDIEWGTMASLLQERAGVAPSADLKLMGWVSDGKLVLVVGFNGWLGKVAQIHLAFTDGWNYSPRKMLREVFRYAFNTCGREMLIGIVNSKNIRAMRLDIHLGFTERFRLPAMHDDDGDLVVLGMMKSECPYLEERDEPFEYEAGHA